MTVSVCDDCQIFPVQLIQHFIKDQSFIIFPDVGVSNSPLSMNPLKETEDLIYVNDIDLIIVVSFFDEQADLIDDLFCDPFDIR